MVVLNHDYFSTTTVEAMVMDKPTKARTWKGMERILKIKEMKKATRDAILEQQFRYLKSQGMVLKGELPSIWDGKGEVMSALEYKKKLVGYYEEII